MYFFGCPIGKVLVYDNYYLTLLDVGNVQISDSYSYLSTLGASVAFDGQSPLVVWYEGSPLHGGAVTAMRMTEAAYNSRHFPPASFVLGTYPAQARGTYVPGPSVARREETARAGHRVREPARDRGLDGRQRQDAWRTDNPVRQP